MHVQIWLCYSQGRPGILGPISRFSAALTPLPGSTHNQLLFLGLQTRQDTSESNYNRLRLTRSCTAGSQSQRLFFTHYFLVDPKLVPTITYKVQQSGNVMFAVCFGRLCWSGSSSGVSCRLVFRLIYTSLKPFSPLSRNKIDKVEHLSQVALLPRVLLDFSL